MEKRGPPRRRIPFLERFNVCACPLARDPIGGGFDELKARLQPLRRVAAADFSRRFQPTVASE